MKNLSLRAFRDSVPKITEQVEVSLRDGAGGIRILGYWTPYPASPDAAPLSTEPLHDHVEGGTATPRPVIKTPADAAAAVRPQPIRAFPKSQQAGRKR